MFGDLKENQNYRTILFSQCTKSMIKGPFGSDMKKSLYVPKGKDTYKVYIQLNAIQRNQSLGNYYISKDYFDKKISRFEVKPNDFIITCDGTLGKLLQLDENMEKGVISSSLLKITLDETVIDSSFFEILWTNVILPNLSRYTRNACLVHLPSVSTIGNLEFHLPDLYLQKEYTKLVKQIDKSKFLLQKILEKLELLKKSRFVEMFGDPVLNPYKLKKDSFRHICEELFAGGDKPSDIVLTKDETHPYPVYANGYENLGFMGFSSQCRVNKPAITISARGTIGFSCIRQAGFTPIVRLLTLIPKTGIDLDYLKFAIDFYSFTSSGTSQKQLTVPDIAKYEVLVPDYSSQQCFATFVHQLDKLKLVIQKSLEDLVGKS